MSRLVPARQRRASAGDVSSLVNGTNIAYEKFPPVPNTGGATTLSQKLREATATINRLEREASHLKSSQELMVKSATHDLQEQLKSAETEAQRAKHELRDALDACTLARTEMQTMRSEIRTMRPAMDDRAKLKHLRDELHQQLKSEEKRRRALLEQVSALTVDGDVAKNKILEANRERDAAVQVKDGLSREVEQLRRRVQGLESRNKKGETLLQQQLSTLRSQLEAAQREKTVLEDCVVSTRVAAEQATRASVSDVAAERKRLKGKVAAARAEGCELGRAEGRGEIERLLSVVKKLEDKVAKVEDRADAAENRARVAEEKTHIKSATPDVVLENRCAVAEARQEELQRQLQPLKRQLHQMAGERDKAAAALAKMETVTESLKAENAIAQSQHREEQERLLQVHASEVGALNNSLAEAVGGRRVAEGRVVELEQRVLAFQDTISISGERGVEVETEVVVSKDAAASSEKVKAEEDEEVAHQEQRRAWEQQHKDSEKVQRKLQNQVTSLQRELQQTKELVDKERAAKNEALRGLTAQLSTATASIERVRKEERATVVKLNDAEARERQLTTVVSALKKRLSSLISKGEACFQEVQYWKGLVESYDQEAVEQHVEAGHDFMRLQALDMQEKHQQQQ